MSLRTLLVDNYDSYTFNLFQLLATVNGVPPTVIKNNEWSWRQLQATIRDQTFDNIVISPGPGTPSNPNDIGVCKSLLASDLGVPILGVCMGCQALGLAHGATISRAPQAVHGKVSAVVHNGHALFHGITSGSEFEVVRYHSLQVDADSLPGCLEPLAWTSGAHHALQSAAPTMGIEPAHSANASAADQDGPVLMALAHRSLPRYGVQFHPESIGTPLGYQLLQNFASLTQAHLGLYDGSTPLPGIPLPRQPKHPSSQQQYSTDGAQASTAEKAYPGPEPSCGGAKPAASSKPLDVLWIHLPGALASVGSSNDLFWSLYGQHEAHDTFWLDSASRDRGRFSYMGGRGGPMWRRFTYRLPPVPCTPTPQASRGGLQPGTLEEVDSNGTTAHHTTHFLTWLDGLLHTWHANKPQPSAKAMSNAHADATGSVMADGECSPEGSTARDDSLPRAALAANNEALQQGSQSRAPPGIQQDVGKLPFDFWGGLVGFLGYELKAECGGRQAHAAPTPDAMLFLADRLIALDHHTGDVYLLAMVDSSHPGAHQLGQAWLHEAHCGIQKLQHAAAMTQEAAAAASAAEAACHRRSTECAAPGHLPPASTAIPESVSDGMQRSNSNSSTLSHLSSSNTGMCMQRQPQHGSSLSMQTHSTQPTDDSMETASAASDAGSEGPAHVQHVSPDIKEPTGPVRCSPSAQHSQHAVIGSPDCAGVQAQKPMPAFRLKRPRQQYMRDVATCLDALAAGESYEVCLTTALARCPAPDARILYPVLRALNPAPYAAWLSFGAQGPQICCSSPERFLKAGQDGWLEARPIKGTAKRHADDPEADQAAAQALVSSEKDRAENLMIVDLMRNDLGRVCQVGSVHVPGLMELESYATVHQLVSTVRGLRRPDASIADCLRATFPGGSMTGAPKIRTMEIIDKLEGSARGVYSGSVGFIGFNNAFDLNIVIRTAVCNQGQISIGAGGAIVVQSGVEDEYTEMRLKARALLAAVGACDDPCHRMPAVVNEDAVYC
ncbi:hypothetical protein WJX74_000597 [Apatococcus lobatus]|uniref:aminodeoxychorismate synthase n=1 Tax=Apatococcus lobatus TaxID=904363 RepID=A0AAW1QL77_9CHLO